MNGKFISSDLCFIITPKDLDKYPIDLKFYHLIFLAFKDEIVRNTKSGTSKESIGLTVFGKYELPYFDIEKQVETREKFVITQESTNKLDAELTHQLDLVTVLRHAFMREAMKGELVSQDPNEEPASMLLEKIKAKKERLIKEKKVKKQKPLPLITEEEIPFGSPDNWAWCRLGDITVNHDGSRVPLSKYERSLKQGEFDYYGAQGVIDQINDYKFDGTYLLIAEDGQNLLRKNKPVAFFAHGKFWVNNHAHVSDCYHDITRYMVANYINTIDLEPYISGKPPSQIKLKRSALDLIVFPLPPLSEQHRIVAKVDELMKYCDELEMSIRASQQQNELLLKQVLTEALGLEVQKKEPQKNSSKLKQRTSKFDPNTTLMEIVELLKKHGKLHAEELWKMSKYPDDIDAFYAELKKQIEFSKTVKESKEKGYLELV